METGFNPEKYGDFSPENFRFAKESKETELSTVEQAEIIDEIDLLLAAIIEQELDPKDKAQKRARINQLCQKLGCDNLDDQRLMDIRLKLANEIQNIPTPNGYPTLEEFTELLKRNLIDANSERKSDLRYAPNVWQVAKDARINYSQIRSRTMGQTLEEYLYNLGKIFGSRRAYEKIFKGDEIKLRPDWSTANGRHRAAALKGLSEEFISQSGMSAWVRIELEDTDFRDPMDNS